MTSNSIQQFYFKGAEVRVLTDEQGEPWFVGKDVADVLGYANASKAVSAHVDTADKRYEMFDIADSQNGNVPIGKTKTILINESGLYSLILSSKLPSAREFKHWVTSEVLPSIRKHGGYISGQEELTPDQLVLKSIEYLQSKIAEQRSQLEAQAPKVLFADAYSASKKCVLVGELAKMLTQNGYKTGQNRLFKQLRDEGYLMKKNGNPNFPTQKSMELGLFEVKTTMITHSDGNEVASFTTKVTPKGQAYFISRYTGNAPTLDIEG